MQENNQPNVRPGRLKQILWLVGMVLTFLGASFMAGWISQRLNLSLLASVSVGQAAILLTALFFTFADGGGFRSLGLFRAWGGWEIAVIPGVIFVHFAGSAVTSIIATMTGQMDPSKMEAMTVFREFGQMAPLPFLGFALLLALQAGLGEEILFRGYLITRLERLGLGAWPTILLSALIFGLVHWTGYGLLASLSKAVFFGIPTGAYFWYRRNLGPLVIAHAAMDFFAFSALFLIMKLTGGQIPGL